tara:strand:+ start:1059 stop:1871 length:813 start_codon:yes stop_codon:yes gene_type:complete
MGLNFNTPLEKYTLKARDVYVKRDDLHNGDLDLPPWAKIEGVRQLLTSELIDKDKPVAHLTVRGSYTGWVLSHYGREYGYDIRIAYGNSKNYPRESLDKIESYGTTLVPLRPNMMRIVYNSLGKLAEKEGWQRLPYAFDHSIYHEYWKNKIKEFCKENDFDNLVILGGSGVTSIGMIKGFLDTENFIMEKKVYLISTSTIASVKNKLKEWETYFPTNVFINDTPYDFYDEMEDYKTPFPCNPYWDKKAWWWLEQNIEKIDGSILFWNIGA